MDYICNHKYYNIRRTLKLINEQGDILRINIIYNNTIRNKKINEWRKLYGKKFLTLLIIESYTP